LTCLLAATMFVLLLVCVSTSLSKENQLTESFGTGPAIAFVIPFSLPPPSFPGTRSHSHNRGVSPPNPKLHSSRRPPRANFRMQARRSMPPETQDWLPARFREGDGSDWLQEFKGKSLLKSTVAGWLPEGWLPEAFRSGFQRLTDTLVTWRQASKLGSEVGRLDSGNTMLFQHTAGVFADVERRMIAETSSSLSRLNELFKTRKAAKVVVMGYAGSGKTETVNLAMALQNEPVTHLNFDMRRWYLRKTSRENKKAYTKGDEHKKAQLALLQDPMVQYEIKESCRQEISKAMSASSTNTIVAFIDEIDLVGAEVLPENIEAIKIWLGLVEEAIGSSPVIQVAVLHPGVAARGSGEAVEAKGFDIEDTIDFSARYSKATQAAIVRAVLTPQCENQLDERGMTLAEYLQGSPGAYKRLLINADGDLSRVRAALEDGPNHEHVVTKELYCKMALESAKESARKGMAQQIIHDMFFDTTRAQKNAISFLHATWPTRDSMGSCEKEAAHYGGCDMPGAARVGSLIKAADGGYMMSPVYHDTLASVLHDSEKSLLG